MRAKDFGLMLLVVVVWGFNFVMIRLGLKGISPFLLGAVRFFCAAFPAVFFVKRPKVPLKDYLLYAMPMSIGQFAFLFASIKYGMPAGLASVVTQVQAVFTVGLAAIFFREPIRRMTVYGFTIAAFGLYVIATAHSATMTMLGFALSIAAAASWATGNMMTKRITSAHRFDMFAFVVWSSLIPPLPFLGISVLIEGPEEIMRSVHHVTGMTIVSVLYIAWLSTLFGYGAWNSLMSKYHAGLVAPFSLLAPIVGLTSTYLLLGEEVSALQWMGVVLVMTGLTLHAAGPRAISLLQLRRATRVANG